MRALDIIIKKRDGLELTRNEISFFITNYFESISITEFEKKLT